MGVTHKWFLNLHFCLQRQALAPCHSISLRKASGNATDFCFS